MSWSGKGPGLQQLLDPRCVALQTSAASWRDAIRTAGSLLVNIGAVEPRYVDTMVRLCEENNAYIVLAPGIAMAHAQPKDGVLRLGVSLTTLVAPVAFGHPQHDPVDLIFAFGAPNTTVHIRLLTELASLLRDDERIAALRAAETWEDVRSVTGSL